MGDLNLLYPAPGEETVCIVPKRLLKTPSSVFDQVVNVHAGARDHVARAARCLSRPTDQTKGRT